MFGWLTRRDQKTSAAHHDIPGAVGFHLNGMADLAAGNLDGARTWFRAAAATDDPNLLFVLGASFVELGDPALAMSCYERSAQAGNVDAMNNLGVLLKRADRWDEAERWLRKAAGTGDRDALNNLGNVLRATGRQDEGVRCYRRAAEAGNVHAMLSLGQLLLVDGDVAQATRWFSAAADTGHPAGRMMLQVAEQASTGSAPEPIRPKMPGPPKMPNSAAARPDAPIRIDLHDLPGTADAMRLRAQASDDPELLDMAVDVARMAVSSSAEDSADLALSLSILCVLLRVRAARAGDAAALDEAIEVGRAGVEAATASGVRWPRCAGALATALLDAHQRGDDAVLVEAVELNREVVTELDIDDVEYAGALANLTNSLVLQSMVDHDPATLDEAVTIGRDALQLIEQRGAVRARVAMSVSQALLQQALATMSVERLKEAWKIGHEALDDTPPGDPNRPAVADFVARLDVANTMLAS